MCHSLCNLWDWKPFQSCSFQQYAILTFFVFIAIGASGETDYHYGVKTMIKSYTIPIEIQIFIGEYYGFEEAIDDTFLSSLPPCRASRASMIPKFGNIFYSFFKSFNLPKYCWKHSGIPCLTNMSFSKAHHRLVCHLFRQNVGQYNLLSWPRIGHKEQEKLLSALYWMPL